MFWDETTSLKFVAINVIAQSNQTMVPSIRFMENYNEEIGGVAGECPTVMQESSSPRQYLKKQSFRASEGTLRCRSQLCLWDLSVSLKTLGWP